MEGKIRDVRAWKIYQKANEAIRCIRGNIIATKVKRVANIRI